MTSAPSVRMTCKAASSEKAPYCRRSRDASGFGESRARAWLFTTTPISLAQGLGTCSGWPSGRVGRGRRCRRQVRGPSAWAQNLWRQTLLRYKRWPFQQILSSAPPEKRIRPESPRGQELLMQEWQVRYLPGGDSGEWKQHPQRWRQSPAPRPSYREGETTQQEQADLLTKFAQGGRMGRPEQRQRQRLKSALCTYNDDWGKITDCSVSERLLDEVSVLRQDRTPQERQAIAVTTM